jgi:hypothetical protein
MRAPSALFSTVVALAAGASTACGEGSSGGREFERGDARLYVLAPSDLGRGYEYGDDSACGSFSPEDESEKFTDFVAETRPAGCTAELQYIWGGARTTVVPRAVRSGAVVFDDEKDARRGMDVRDDLIEFVTAESPRRYSEVPDFGHEAVLFRNGGFDVPPGAGVLWRNDNMLAVVFAGGAGLDVEKASKVAISLAREQQARIDDPKPAPPQEDDPELPLDDPQLDAPVYWLGRQFEPGGGLPSLGFSNAHSYGGSGGEPTFTAELDYGAENARRTYGLKLAVYTPSAFEGFSRSLLGRLVRGTGCAEASTIDLPKGRAVIWGGFAKPTRPPCPRKPYDRYFAHVFFDGAVVTINHPWCVYPCLANPQGAADPYNTPRGLEAVARALKPRAPPTDN